jgi:hypothetical protein
MEAIDKDLVQPNLDKALASGWQTVTCFQNTELAVEMAGAHPSYRRRAEATRRAASLMIVNRDQHAHQVHIFFQSETDHTASSFVGKVDIATFGRGQYQWHPGVTRFAPHAEHAGDLSVVANTKGMADPDSPIVHTNLTTDHATGYDLPAAWIVVIRGRVGLQE